MKKIAAKMNAALLIVAVGAVAACSSNKSSETNASKSAHLSADKQKMESSDGSFTGEIIGVPAVGSKFSKLKIGMSQAQVASIVGHPTDQKSYSTGKAWIPFAGAFSGDTYRLEAYYKNEGRLVYAKNGAKLYRIDVDTKEDGFQ